MIHGVLSQRCFLKFFMHSLRLHDPPQPPIWCYTTWTGYSEKSPLLYTLYKSYSVLPFETVTVRVHIIHVYTLQTSTDLNTYCLTSNTDRSWRVWFAFLSRPPLIPVLSPSKRIIYCNFVSTCIKFLRAVRAAYTHIKCTPINIWHG